MHGGNNAGAGARLVWRPGLAAAWKARRAYIERRHVLGLRVPGGRPRKFEKVQTMAEQAKRELVARAVELEARLPADVMTRPVESLAPAEALGRAALSGIHQLIRIIEEPLQMGLEPEALKQRRLIGDMSLGAGKLYMRAAEGEFQQRRPGALDELLAEIRAAKEERSASGLDSSPSPGRAPMAR